MSSFAGVIDAGKGAFDAKVSVGCEGLAVSGPMQMDVSYADLMDMRLLNYRIRLVMREGDVWVSQLGYQTEDFFEKLWTAYAARSREALFVAGRPAMTCEGDYAYHEPRASAHGIARLEVFDECLCIYPHDVGARRVPLCFVDSLEREGYRMTLTLDTGETYEIARLGRDTEGFFERVTVARARSLAHWEDAHAKLRQGLVARLGDATGQYRAFEDMGSRVDVGLFSWDADEFWFVAVRDGRAAVEFVGAGDAATYLYRYRTGDDEFVVRLRHAMEAVKKNRRLIFLDDAELLEVPLYRMALDRSAHVSFLRECNAGRVIHGRGWEKRLRTFFA